MYEKGPQTLAETIREGEKLQAAQQITSTILPTSSVNTLSSEMTSVSNVKKPTIWHAIVPI